MRRQTRPPNISPVHVHAVLFARLLCVCCAFVSCGSWDLGILREAVKFGGFHLNGCQIIHFQIEARATLKRAPPPLKVHYTVISKKEVQNTGSCTDLTYKHVLNYSLLQL